jgi:hypothetical protein
MWYNASVARALTFLIRLILLTLLGVAAGRSAWAHPGHHAVAHVEAAADAAPRGLGSPALLTADAAQVAAARGCPGDDGGECCCDKLVAHAPQPQPQPLAPPSACTRPELAPTTSSVGVAQRTVAYISRIVIGSFLPRGPPTLLHASPAV